MPRGINIYFHDENIVEIDSRGDNRSHIVNRDLDRLYTLYRRALKEIPLTLKETRLIVDALNTSMHDALTAPMLWATIEDAIKLEYLAEKWEIDGSALVKKLQELSAFHCMALVDAAERFWNLPDHQNDQALQKIFNIT